MSAKKNQIVVRKPSEGKGLPDVHDALVERGFKPPFKLDLGCGNIKTKDHVGLDIVAVPQVDVVCNLEWGIPLRDNCVVAGVANQFFEHLHRDNVLPLIDEIHRVFQVGGIMRIMVPHYMGPYAWADPGHRVAFAEGYFLYLTPERGKQMFNVGRRRFWSVEKLEVKKEQHYGMMLPVLITAHLKKI